MLAGPPPGADTRTAGPAPGRTSDLWKFVHDFQHQFVLKVVRGETRTGAAGGVNLAQTIRQLASDEQTEVEAGTEALRDMVHGLFGESEFLRHFGATWGVVLLWDDFRQTFINTGGFTRLRGLDEARYRFASALVSHEDVFRRYGFTEPMTEFIFRATKPPRPMVMHWPRTRAAIGESSQNSVTAPLWLGLEQLESEGFLTEAIEALTVRMMERLQAPDSHVEWFASGIVEAARKALDDPQRAARLGIRELYERVRQEYEPVKARPPEARDIQSTLQTMIWNRLLDDTWNFLYFVPTQLPGPRAVSGLVLACESELDESEYTALLEITNRVLSVFHFGIYAYQKNRFALQAAVTAIMARNMSHNIGSHVMPRARAEQVHARLAALAPSLSSAQCHEAAGLIRDRLEDYIQKKADYLSEITTDPLMSTRPAMFFQDVVLPFLQSPLLMDNLAANENVRFEREGDIPRSSLMLQVQVRVPDAPEPVPVRARFRCDVPGCRLERNLPGDSQRTPGYSLRCPYHQGRLLVPGIEHSDVDVRVDLPGPLGEFAFYGFVENLVRNAAKHNRKGAAARGITITIEIEDDATSSEFYSLRIWDSVSSPTTPVGKPAVPLHEYLNDQIKRPFVDDAGQIQREAWGLKEMIVCAGLLAGVRDFAAFRTKPPLTVADNDGRLLFTLRLMRSRAVLALLPQWHEQGDVPSIEKLERQGIRVVAGLPELERALGHGAASRTGQFAVIDVPGYGTSDEEAAFLQWLSASLHRLPLRVLLFDPASRFRGLLPRGVSTIAEPFDATTEHWQDSVELLSWLWPQWLARWSVAPVDVPTSLVPGIGAPPSEQKPALVQVYFQQRQSEEPTKSWTAKSDEFNRAQSSLLMYMGSLDRYGAFKLATLFRGWSKYQVLIDRHGDMIEGLPPFEPDTDVSYLALGKDSPDFVPLFSAALPPKHEPWLLPWELAEAGLVRVLVIDERITESSYTLIPRESHRHHDLAPEKWRSRLLETGETDGPIWDWHVAWLAKVYLCTHFGFRDEPQALHPSIDDIRKADSRAPTLKVRVDGGVTSVLRPYGPAGRTITDAAFDVVLIHQGVLDSHCGGNVAACLDAFHRDVGPVVVESGRGVPLTLPAGERFLPFSVVQHYLLGTKIGKLGLTRMLMSVARVGKASHG